MPTCHRRKGRWVIDWKLIFCSDSIQPGSKNFLRGPKFQQWLGALLQSKTWWTRTMDNKWWSSRSIHRSRLQALLAFQWPLLAQKGYYRHSAQTAKKIKKSCKEHFSALAVALIGITKWVEDWVLKVSKKLTNDDTLRQQVCSEKEWFFCGWIASQCLK